MSTPTGDPGGQQYGGQPGGQGGDQYGAPQYGQGQQYGSAPYGGQSYPGGPGQPAVPPKNGFGITALVLGIVGIVTSFFYIGGLLGLLAIVFGILGMGRAKRGEATNRGVAIGGLITGVLAVLITIVVIILAVVLVSAVNNSGYAECLQQAGSDPAAAQQCAEQLGSQITGN